MSSESNEKKAKQHLIYSILKFLEGEIKAEADDAERRETMEVACQCLETAYTVSSTTIPHEELFGPAIDFVSILKDATVEATLRSENPALWTYSGEHMAPSVPLTDDMRQKADKLKNEGNELVKQEKYREALEAYNAAIEIDGNNAIYYCNRAAAHNKLSNNDQALTDCFRSIEIDPNYSKAYGRLGVIYLSLDRVHEALDAYKHALALEPNNDTYKQSVKICEDRLNALGSTASAGPSFPPMFGSLFGAMGARGGFGGLAGAAGGPDMMSLLNNPSLMNMAMQFVQNPQVQGLMANLVSDLNAQEGGDVSLQSLLETGQRMASELSLNNPDLVESLRRNMNTRTQSDENDSSAFGDDSDKNIDSENHSDQDKPPSS